MGRSSGHGTGLRSRVASAVGGAVGGVLGGAGALRRGKPLHPKGLLFEATLTTWGGDDPRWDVPLLDEPAETRCLVRISRSVGFPEPVPDIHGVAVRLEEPDVDLLFSTTGTGRLTRYVLLLRRSDRASMTTLMPLRTSAGALQLRPTPEPADGRRRA